MENTSPDTPISEDIVRRLSDGPLEKATLLHQIVADRKVTEQGFYKALASLKHTEVISEHEGMLSLSVVWIQQEMDRISSIASAYGAPVYEDYFGYLTPGDKASYRFKTLRELDLFWTHAVSVAVRHAKPGSPLISIVPHDWFEHVRPESARVWDSITGPNPHCVVLTHAAPAEEKYSTHGNLASMERLLHENPFGQKESTYVNVVDDMVFEARLDTRAIPSLREAMLVERPDTSFLALPGRYSLSVSKDSRKAERIKSRLRRYFTISF